MSATVINRTAKGCTIQMEIEFSENMLGSEEMIQKTINEAGGLATREALLEFDTDGSPIIAGGTKMTSKCQHTEKYQTPYGAINVNRHIYQSSKGGRSYCPLETDARLILNSTPLFAKQMGFKYSCNGAVMVARDFTESHGRSVSIAYVRQLGDAVGEIALAKEETWEYEIPNFLTTPTCISIGLDGTCMNIRGEGWREAMTGTITFYNKAGERMHTIYMGAPPEYGKSTFKKRFIREIERVKAMYPKAHYQGLADGAVENWMFLEPFVDSVVLDFFHASEYIGKAAQSIFPKNDIERIQWLEDRLHTLKHKSGSAKRLLNEMIRLKSAVKKKDAKEQIEKTITYFKNNYLRMNYAANIKVNRPIGSGVTEAACKTLVKQRLANSGMRWKTKGAAVIMATRALVLTAERWGDFWKKFSRHGGYMRT